MRRFRFFSAFSKRYSLLNFRIHFVWVLCIGLSLTGYAQHGWTYNYTGYESFQVPFVVNAYKVGDQEEAGRSHVYARAVFWYPPFDEVQEYRQSFLEMAHGQCSYAKLSNPTEKLPIEFTFLTHDPHAIDYCYVDRYTEKQYNSTIGFTPAQQGAYTYYCVRHDSISLWDLLLKGNDTIEVPDQEKTYYVYRLEPGWSAAFQDAPAEYGHRQKVRLKADVTFCRTPYSYEAFSIFGTYQVGNGSKKILPYCGQSTELSFSLSDLEDAQIGDLITIDALGVSPGNKHRKTIRFYPELPPYIIPTQQIAPTDSLLRTITVRLVEPIDSRQQEHFTTLTCYKSISTRADGIFNIAESEVAFQINVSNLLVNAGDIQIPIPKGYELKKGNYYITIEGMVGGESNRPDVNIGNYSATAINAMFPCHKLRVVKNEMRLEDLVITPAKCANTFGKVSFRYTTFGFLSAPETYEVYEWQNEDWVKSPLFKINNGVSGARLQMTIQADSVPQGYHRFAFRRYIEGKLSAHSEFECTIPIVSPVRWEPYVKNISGTIVEGSSNRTTDDGMIVIFRDEIYGATPPYDIYYRKVDGTGGSGGTIVSGEKDVILPPGGRAPSGGSSFVVGNNPKKFPSNDTLKVTAAAPYHLTFSDANGCTTERFVEVKLLKNKLGLRINEERPISCNGQNDGVLKAVLTGNISERDLMFSWICNGKVVSNEALCGPIEANQVYSVQVRHRYLPNLRIAASKSLSNPAPFSLVSSSVSPIKCHGSRSGAAALVISGGTPPLSGLWDNYTVGFRIENVPAGRYQLKVSDAHQCTKDYTVTIAQPSAPLRLVVDSIEHVYFDAQNNLKTGYLNMHASGGTPPYGRISRNTILQNFPLRNLTSGDYTFTVSDANGCTVDTTIRINTYYRLSAYIDKKHEVSCFNGYDGACYLNVNGGYPPVDVKWSNGQTTRYLDNLPPGTYRATVKDAKNNVAVAEMIFNEPAPLVIDNVQMVATSYAGYQNGVLPGVAADGRISAVVKGGTPPYRYTWTALGGTSSGAAAGGSTAGGGGLATYNTSEPILEHCAGGKYRLTVIDENDCFTSKEITLPVVPPLQALLVVQKDVRCYGEASGELLVKANGGTPPYRYWVGSEGTKPNGGGASGSADTAACGNVASGATDTIRHLTAGRYTLTVADSKGVVSVATVMVNEPPLLGLTAMDIEAASYSGSVNGLQPDTAQDGMARVMVSGGSGARQLTWINAEGRKLQETLGVDPLSVLRNVRGGNYTILAEDTHGCRDSLGVVIPQSDNLWCAIKQTDSILCHGGNEAMALVSVIGGEPPYRYRLEMEGTDDGVAAADNAGSTDGAELRFPLIWKLRSGYYTFYVTDQNNIESRFRFYIPEPDVLQGELKLSPSLCHEPETGVAKAVIQGGTSPYTYVWHGNGFALPDTTAVVKGLGNSRLDVRVQDRNGCVLTLSKRIEKPQPLVVWATASEETYQGSAYGQLAPPRTDGAIRLDARGGTPPYAYEWQRREEDSERVRLDDTLSFIDKRSAGEYHYRVRDAHGCAYEETVEIVKTPDLRSGLVLKNPVLCGEKPEGGLQAEVSGGVPPYTYEWQRATQPLTASTDVAEGLYKGTYFLTVTDAKGVKSTDSFLLDGPLPLSVAVRTKTVSGYGAADGHLEYQVSGGVKPYAVAWQGTSAWLKDTTQWAEHLPDSLPSGFYRLTLTDSNGCLFEQSYLVDSPDSLTLSNLHIVHCRGEKVFLTDSFSSENNGRIRAYLSGGVPPYRVVWRDENGAVIFNQEVDEAGDVGLSDLKAGEYAISVTDAHGYGLNSRFEVELSTALQVMITESVPILCHGDSGVIAVRADGGKAPYTYKWFRVEDLDGATVADCSGNTAVAGDVGADARDATMRKLTPLPFTSSESAPLGSGLYRVEVQDAWGTKATDSLFLDEPAALRLEAELKPLGEGTGENKDNASAGEDHAASGDSPAGLLYLNPMGGCPPYRYDWAHGDTADHIAYRHGNTYSVTVYDKRRCAVQREFPFNNKDLLEARIELVQAISCHNSRDGALNVEILGGQPPYRVLWSCADTGVLVQSRSSIGIAPHGDIGLAKRSDTTLTLHHLPPALYELSVMDAEGHTCATAFRLTAPSPLTSHITATLPRCHGREDGVLSAETSGGSYPYTYQWQNVSANAHASSPDDPAGTATGAAYRGLKKGLYRLTITDRNGCTLIDSIHLGEPLPLQPLLTADQPICPRDKGQLHAQAIGGTPPYQYQWRHESYIGTEPIVQDASAGYYLLSVTDSLLCRADTAAALINAASLQWQPFETKYLCQGQSIILQPLFIDAAQNQNDAPHDTTQNQNTAQDLIGFWRMPNGETSSGLTTESAQNGLHRLTMIQYGKCLYTDTVRIITVDDTVSCQFWISTQLMVNETVTAVDVSHPSPDSSHWTLPLEAELLSAEGPYAEFSFRSPGIYPITLTSYKGLCSQSKTTLVEVLPENRFKSADNEALTPFIDLSVAPNPTKGSTNVMLHLKHTTDVEYALIEAVSGRIHQKGKWPMESGPNTQTIELPHQSGLYLLVLYAEKTTKHLKIIVTKH